jgi:transmembrane sensor
MTKTAYRSGSQRVGHYELTYASPQGLTTHRTSFFDSFVIAKLGRPRHRVEPVKPIEPVRDDYRPLHDGSSEDRGAAIDRLFREHNRKLVGLLVTRLRNEQEAKEVAQEAYVKLLQLEATPGTISYLRSYLFRVAENLAIDRIRQRRIRTHLDQLDSTDDLFEEPQGEKAAIAEQEAAILKRAVAELPEVCRQVFTLHKLSDRPIEEVARLVGLKERMVRRYLRQRAGLPLLALRRPLGGRIMEGDPMKPDVQTIDLQRVNRLGEASEWLLRLQSPDRSEAEYSNWLRWCDADPENFAAFETVQRKWQDLDALKDRYVDANRLIANGGHAGTRARGAKATWAMAACVAVVALTIGFIQYRRAQPDAAPPQVAATLTNRVATLPDGSKMILGVQSLVNMDFNGPERELDLSSGEAYFKVKHDKIRPFVVRAGVVSVTAIGTAFDIRRDREKITVTVEEGTVEVRGVSPGKNDVVWRAEAGYQLTYSPEHRTASLASINPATALTWRNGDLAYLYEPLGSVVEDLNRYSRRKIVIADPEVAEIAFTGTVFTASLEGWLAAVKQAYPVDVKESATGEVILSARK